ncbi:MAG: hypothetical protein HC831_29925, partial [Chloroflexia bacterium]|nr:hypothetical protein [Chloroflexia bacterium]
IKHIPVNEAIQGIYTFWDNEFLDNPNIVGYLALYSGNYYFTYLNFNDLSKNSKEIASEFCFANIVGGKYKLEFKDKVNRKASIAEYDDNEILATINFFPDHDKNPKTIKQLLIRTDKDREHVYFHSTKSELQLWNISKLWKEDGISDAEAIKIADKEAESNLNEVNQSEFAKNFTYQFNVEDYNKKQGLCIVRNQVWWYILYTYTFKHAAKDEIHFAGHPAHFTVRIDQKSKETQLLHGE